MCHSLCYGMAIFVKEWYIFSTGSVWVHVSAFLPAAARSELMRGWQQTNIDYNRASKYVSIAQMHRHFDAKRQTLPLLKDLIGN